MAVGPPARKQWGAQPPQATRVFSYPESGKEENERQIAPEQPIVAQSRRREDLFGHSAEAQQPPASLPFQVPQDVPQPNQMMQFNQMMMMNPQSANLAELAGAAGAGGEKQQFFEMYQMAIN